MVVAGPSHLFRLERRADRPADGERLVPTDLVRGPWDHGLLHGGAVSGALGWAVDRVMTDSSTNDGEGAGFRLCRMTTEILRPVPVAPLDVVTRTVRAGRRSRVIDAELAIDGRTVARASSQWALARPPTEGVGDRPADPAVPRRPTEVTDPGADTEIGYPRPGFNCDVFELRCLVGSTEEAGPGTVWARMKVDLVEGESTGPVHRLATVADLANAVGWDRSTNDEPMINPDLTLQLSRYPVGPWVCLEAAAKVSAEGIGMMETTLWDGDGRFGRVLSTTVESPVSLAVDL